MNLEQPPKEDAMEEIIRILAKRDSELEVRIMQNVGNMMAVNCAVFALLYAFPDREGLAGAFLTIRKMMDEGITKIVMMEDEVSENTHHLTQQYNEIIAKIEQLVTRNV
jgi:hypothetical protein